VPPSGTAVGSDPRGLLSRPASEVAPALLGWTITHEAVEGLVSVELTEVEAYAGQADPASHAFRGPSPRNAVMFGTAGHLYVYLSHGLHWCANVVTGPEGEASAVLLRAGKVTKGVELARARRGGTVPDRSLARGPGCLGQALGLSKEYDGSDLLSSGPLILSPPLAPIAEPISTGPRVGVSRASDVPWRYWLTGEPTVSAYRPGGKKPQGRSGFPAT
jgi:DNA-3-methyladenine glycosylase